MATLHVQRLRRIVQLVQSSSVTKLVRLKIIMINCSYWMQEYDRPELKELVMEEILEELQR